jgi:hypothetical protein
MRTIRDEAHLRMTMPDVPYRERGRVLPVFLVLLASYGYFFPRLNNWDHISAAMVAADSVSMLAKKRT